ncbi:hypothetical protein IV203_036303 [Nitzschia inconspicua]|uniref:Uncharacterized protein n=1 Tax=Nitzschia inconspicua TaxID=303405 RepID=A0A9K3K5A8_9STRA|nr:hypothetical protein IV203_006707 [Nitzschia inconspicua]KAG7361203.1 hypothetical protein IV203_036303 [Nitzschia inconspicua]
MRRSSQELLEADVAAGERIVRSIASYLSFSDAVSIASTNGGVYPMDESSFTNNNDWAVGTSVEPPRWSIRRSHSNNSGSVTGMSRGASDTLITPPTPAVVAISPNPDFEFEDYLDNRDDEENFDDEAFQNERRREWAKQKLAAAVFSHPESLRSFCRDAYIAAKEVTQNQTTMIISQNDETTSCNTSSCGLLIDEESPETLVEPRGRRHQGHRHHYGLDERLHMITELLGNILDNVPLSVALDVLGGFREVTLDSSFASVRITSMTVHGIVDACIHITVMVWDGVTHFNPLDFAHMVITRPFNMMGKTTEVVVSGIQSVATGVGSASSIALHRLSAKNQSNSSLLGSQGNLRRVRSPMSKKLLKKLSTLNSAASVISYTELDDSTGGLSRHAKSRVQRMMHYDVSLRPFVATVKLQESFKRDSSAATDGDYSKGEDASSDKSSPLEGSPFMCTPQSFPPTPHSRRMVLARGTRFSDDVIFLARDQLRVHDGLQSTNERTKEMAQTLTQAKRLAVFDADDASAGIDLTCGQHVATKVGNLLYCSTRSMIPILRNCFVYYEMTVLGRSGSGLISQTSMATLSVGLSTKEMPPNTLVGAWKGSVGLCTTGQILVAGQWYSPDPTISSFGDRATVGCLVCLDDSSAFETWDGLMVTANVTFNINGQIVRPPVPNMHLPGSGDQLPTSPPNAQHSNLVPSLGTAPPSFTLPLLVPAEEELYPTLTLHSPGTSVMCRFSAGDIVAKFRESIGAPKKVPVYSCDGSIVFEGED